MSGDQDFNISQVADCIKQQNNIGHTVFYNICNGTQHTVPWGTGDWVGMTVGIGVGLLAILLIIFFVLNDRF